MDVILLDFPKAFDSVTQTSASLSKLFNRSVATGCFARQLFVIDSGKIRCTSGNNFRANLVHNGRF